MFKNLDKLSPAEVQRNLEIAKQLSRELDAEQTVETGPYHDVLLYYTALFSAAQQREISNALRCINVGRLLQDPNAVHPQLVDRVMANWALTRKTGAPSAGLVTVLLVEKVNTIIPAGTVLHANGHTFKVMQTYHLRTNAANLAPTDRVLVQHFGCVWGAALPVQAITKGATSNLRSGTQLAFERTKLPTVQRVLATHDFTGGLDDESNAQFVSNLACHISGKVGNNRLNYEAALRQHPLFERATAISIIGADQPEMVRDVHGVGGHVDVYIKPSTGVMTKLLKLQGIYTNTVDGASFWSIHIPPDAAPGFFYVSSVQHEGQTCEIVEDLRTFDPTHATKHIRINDPLDAVYSAFQGAVIEVKSKEEYTSTVFEVTVRYIPGLLEAQQHLDVENTLSPTGDLLVKAPIPCFTSVVIAVQPLAGQPVDVAAIKEAIAATINSTGFTGTLAAQQLINAIAAVEHRAYVSSVVLSGKLRHPDGHVEKLESATSLHIPTSGIVSSRTVAFFQDVADVLVSVL